MGKTSETELDDCPSEEILQKNPKSSAITRRNMEIKRKKSFGMLANGVSQGATLEKALLSEQNRILAQENENLRQIVRGKNAEILDYKQQIFELSAQRISLEQKLIKYDKRISLLENELKRVKSNVSQSETLLDQTFDISVNDRDKQSLLQMTSLIGDINELTKNFPSIIEKMYLLNKVARGCMGVSSNQTMASCRSSMTSEQVEEEEENDEVEENEEEEEAEKQEEGDEDDALDNEEMVENDEEDADDTLQEEPVLKPMIATAIQEEDEEQEEGDDYDESNALEENEELIEETNLNETSAIDEDQSIQEKSELSLKNARKSLKRVSFCEQIDTEVIEAEETFSSEVNTTYNVAKSTNEIDKTNSNHQETKPIATLDITFDKPKTKQTLKTYKSRPKITKLDDTENNSTNKTYNIEKDKENDEEEEENEEKTEDETILNEIKTSVIQLTSDDDDKQASPTSDKQKQRIINLFEDSLTSTSEPTPKPVSKSKPKKQKAESKVLNNDHNEESKKKSTRNKMLDEGLEDDREPNNKQLVKTKKTTSSLTDIKSKGDNNDDEDEVIEPKKKITRTASSASKLPAKTVIQDDNFDVNEEELKSHKTNATNFNAKQPLNLEQIRKNTENVELKNHQQHQKQTTKTNEKTFVISATDESEDDVKVVKEKPPAPPMTKPKQVLKSKQQVAESIKPKKSLTKSIKKTLPDVSVNENDSVENQDPSINLSGENESFTSSNGNDTDNGRSRRSRKQVTYTEIPLHYKLRRDDDNQAVLIKVGKKSYKQVVN